MKFIYATSILFLITLLFSCTNEPLTENEDVEEFVAALRADEYQNADFHNFTSDDISDLFEYINDDSKVTMFPRNPLSSYLSPNPEFRLGVLVLWTIESIRVSKASQSPSLVFPSLNPFVSTKSAEGEWIENHDDPVYSIIKEAYQDWWDTNGTLQFSDIDPLEGIDYRWH